MASLWSIIVPEAGTNYCLNPSAETTGNYSAHNSATVTLDTTYARFGNYAYKIVPGGTSRGLNATLSSLPNAAAYVTFYAVGASLAALAGTITVSLDSGSNYNTASVIGGATGGWVRYGVSIAQAQANASTSCIIRNSANETFYLDGIQVESASYYTTYIDGDQGTLYRWSGLRHGSTSTRDAQDRLGGRERDLSDYGVYIEGHPGLGAPPVVNNLVGQSLQPGAAFQSTKILPRTVTLKTSLPGTSLANLHSVRKSLIDLVKSSRVRGNQPFVLGYSGALSTKKVYAAFRYDGGLEFGERRGFLEEPPLRCVAVDPFWYEDNRETQSLTLQASVSSSAYANRRTNGQWLALGSGMGAAVYRIAVDKQRGRVYFGGGFTTGNGVTLNRIGYWSGTTFVAMDSGVNGNVYAIAIAANGDVWIGGAFTTVGSGAATCKGLARWNVSSGTWTAFNPSATFTQINTIAIDSTGLVYIGGNFTNWDGIGNADYIAKYDGSAWSALGTGMDSNGVSVIAVEKDSAVWVGGTFTAGNGVTLNGVGYWNGTTFVSVGGLTGTAVAYAFVFAPGGVYVLGNFASAGGITAASAAFWNGTSFAPLGTGANSAVTSGVLSPEGLLYIGGTFTSAGGLALADRLAVWNGSTWFQADIDLPGTPQPYSIVFSGSDLFIGYDTTGTATAAGLTTITPTATAPVFPTFTLIGPSSASAVLQWLENQSTGHRLYFNLTVYSGETITINLTPGSRSVVSDWRGVISSQPLSNSDWSSWHLLGSPATNTVAAFVTGTTTGAALVAHWTPRHLGSDGAAV